MRKDSRLSRWSSGRAAGQKLKIKTDRWTSRREWSCDEATASCCYDNKVRFKMLYVSFNRTEHWSGRSKYFESQILFDIQLLCGFSLCNYSTCLFRTLLPTKTTRVKRGSRRRDEKCHRVSLFSRLLWGSSLVWFPAPSVKVILNLTAMCWVMGVLGHLYNRFNFLL